MEPLTPEETILLQRLPEQLRTPDAARARLAVRFSEPQSKTAEVPIGLVVFLHEELDEIGRRESKASDEKSFLRSVGGFGSEWYDAKDAMDVAAESRDYLARHLDHFAKGDPGAWKESYEQWLKKALAPRPS